MIKTTEVVWTQELKTHKKGNGRRHFLMEEFTQSEGLCHSPQLGHTPKIQSEDGFASWDLEANAIKFQMFPALQLLEVFGSLSGHSYLAYFKHNKWMKGTFSLQNPKYYSPIEHAHPWA